MAIVENEADSTEPSSKDEVAEYDDETECPTFTSDEVRDDKLPVLSKKKIVSGCTFIICCAKFDPNTVRWSIDDDAG